MWYQIHEPDIYKLRIGDMLMKHNEPVMPELIINDKNEFYIIEAVKDDAIQFKKAAIIKSSINYSYTCLVTDQLFKNDFWYCFEKRYVTY
jgi:hypothetical protein